MLSQLKGASSYMIDEKTEQPTSVALLQSRLSSEHAYTTKPCSSAIFSRRNTNLVWHGGQHHVFDL